MVYVLGGNVVRALFVLSSWFRVLPHGRINPNVRCEFLAPTVGQSVALDIRRSTGRGCPQIYLQRTILRRRPSTAITHYHLANRFRKVMRWEAAGAATFDYLRMEDYRVEHLFIEPTKTGCSKRLLPDILETKPKLLSLS